MIIAIIAYVGISTVFGLIVAPKLKRNFAAQLASAASGISISQEPAE